MMAAIAAVHAGADVVLLEKMERVGKKLAITGKGRCNITSAVPGDELVKGFPARDAFCIVSLTSFPIRI
jgi:predicted flavoprotein YhiN